jgi:hypothetical protein
MLIFAIANHLLVKHTDMVARTKELIQRLLKACLAYPCNTNSQTYRQTKNINPVVPTTLIERL